MGTTEYILVMAIILFMAALVGNLEEVVILGIILYILGIILGAFGLPFVEIVGR